MWTSYAPNFDPVTRSTSLALLCTILSQVLITQESELLSELMCWVLLPVIFKVAERLETTNQVKQAHESIAVQSRPSRSIWVLAICLSVVSFYKAEHGLVLLYPILPPSLQAAQIYIGFDASLAIGLSSTSSVQFGALSGAFAAIALSYHDIAHSGFSAIAVFAQFLVYVSFLPRDGTKLRALLFVDDFEQAIVSLSKYTILALLVAISLQNVLFGFTADQVAITLFAAILKALSWYFTAHAAKQTSWIIAPLIHTVALLSTLNPFHQSSMTHASLLVIASLLSLAQAIQILGKHSRSRYYLWAFSLVSLVPYLINVCIIRSATLDAELTYSNLAYHPVEVMVKKGGTEFEEMIRRQSKSLDAAEEEYKRRYNIGPAPGFKAWYNFTVSNNSPIIDDFDTVYHSVSPFWQLSGQQVNYVMGKAYAKSGSDLWLCKFRSNSGKTSCRHAWRTNDRHIELLFNRLLGEMKGIIPDVSFLVNHCDEPRVATPPVSENSKADAFNLTVLSHQPVWEEVTKFCQPPYHNAVASTDDMDTFGLPFFTSQTSSMDLCHHSEHRDTHGLFQSPASFRLFSGLVPVLSTGAPSTMSDILFPSPAYIEDQFQYNEDKDIPWEQKRNEVFWAGSTTGGFANNDGWRTFHRQRFVTLVQGLESKQHTYLRKRDGVLRRVQSSFLDGRFFHVAFTRIFQCDQKYCRDQKAYFRTKPRSDKHRAYKSRIAFDLDGNGISGRYYQLLASRSVPLKQTLLREWHDNRLFPWVHYIPISQSMEELPELVSYLTSSEAGQQRAREIAEQGREWYSKALREVDMQIYVYRLLLEVARLQDYGREAST